jgi:large subunit ribosomal protein L15
VNLDTLQEVFDADSSVTPEVLRERGLVRKTGVPVKVLGRGDLAKKLTVRAHKFSGTAATKIAAAGGVAEVIEA